MNCHICDNVTELFLDEKRVITYYFCKKCEYIFKSPENYQDFELQKERYGLHENNEEDEGYKVYFQKFLDFVMPLIDKPSTALDFGCGTTSLLASMLEEQDVNTDYYDPIYYPIKSYNSKKYELIVSTEVFEHLHNPKDIFVMLLDRLDMGGYLALQTEFHPNNETSFKKWWYPRDETHIVFFRPKTFKVLCKKYGCNYVSDNGRNMVLIQKI